MQGIDVACHMVDLFVSFLIIKQRIASLYHGAYDPGQEDKLCIQMCTTMSLVKQSNSKLGLSFLLWHVIGLITVIGQVVVLFPCRYFC